MIIKHLNSHKTKLTEIKSSKYYKNNFKFSLFNSISLEKHMTRLSYSKWSHTDMKEKKIFLVCFMRNPPHLPDGLLWENDWLKMNPTEPFHSILKMTSLSYYTCRNRCSQVTKGSLIGYVPDQSTVYIWR